MTLDETKQERLDVQRARLASVLTRLRFPSLKALADELAARLGDEALGYATLRNYHQGRRESSVDYYDQLASVFGVRLAYLVQGEGDVLADGPEESLATFPEVLMGVLKKEGDAVGMEALYRSPAVVASVYFAVDRVASLRHVDLFQNLTDAEQRKIAREVVGLVLNTWKKTASLWEETPSRRTTLPSSTHVSYLVRSTDALSLAVSH